MRRILEILVLIMLLVVGVLSALSLYVNLRKTADETQTPPAIEQETETEETA